MLVFKNPDELAAQGAEPFEGQVVYFTETEKKMVFNGKKWVAYKKSIAKEGLPPEEAPKPFREDG